MSYCVHCGVQLADSEKSCPLCQTEVLNPKKPWVDPTSRPYSDRVDTFVAHVDRKFGVGIASLFLLIPAAVTLITDFLTSRSITWSAYVLGACALVYVAFLFPLLFQRKKPYPFILFDCVCLLLYLFFIDRAASHSVWFWTLACPVTIAITIFVSLVLFMLRLRDYPNLYKAAVILSACGILCVAIEITLLVHHSLPFQLNWSLFALSPCVVLSMMMAYTERHKKLKDTIRRRLFY